MGVLLSTPFARLFTTTHIPTHIPTHKHTHTHTHARSFFLSLFLSLSHSSSLSRTGNDEGSRLADSINGFQGAGVLLRPRLCRCPTHFFQADLSGVGGAGRDPHRHLSPLRALFCFISACTCMCVCVCVRVCVCVCVCVCVRERERERERIQ